MITKVKEEVMKEATDWDWKFHISLVVKYAKHLAKIEDVDEELVEIAALLHDIGRIKFGSENHEITGPLEAEKILKNLNYSPQFIEEVKNCIKTHRASQSYQPETKAAEIIRDADAIAHFDVIPVLIQVGLKKYDGNIEKTIEWLDAKVDRDWNNKMHLPESKILAEKKYLATKLLLKSTKNCF